MVIDFLPIDWAGSPENEPKMVEGMSLLHSGEITENHFIT